MNRVIGLVVMAVIGLAVLQAASPAVVSLLHAAWPFVLVVGVLVIVGRIVWFFTNRW